MKTKLKITLVATLILLMSTGVAMALSMDYTTDFAGKKKSFQKFGSKKAHAFNFDTDLEPATISNATLTIKHSKNKKNGFWGFYIGEKYFGLDKSKKWTTQTFDVTDAIIPGSPLSIVMVGKKGKINMDWMALNINYDDMVGVLPGGDPIGGSPAPVPEPGTLVLLGVGLLVVARLGFKKMNGPLAAR